ncbi:DNA-binding PadR family transcriptional regulator [Virgibacillus halotolerans]|uniref:PadR family transcriptional regulator n=1 Tax=Virgibacillus halotolerans TaxID=1071053 RepID=UPI00195F5BD8|nr:helix-turn-helix transcriptional regulator [Virgibacillus halotolerans]MBM7601594.1 DNA-binding PadR family transcriptional regulator [Virgibacillus halotolerans]
MEDREHIPLTEAVYYILLALQTPMHGYGIMQHVKEISNDRVNLGPGTLYGAIKTLLKKEWIQLVTREEASRKKEYELTDTGKAIVFAEIDRLQELLNNGKRIMEGKENDH